MNFDDLLYCYCFMIKLIFISHIVFVFFVCYMVFNCVFWLVFCFFNLLSLCVISAIVYF